jgi:exopolysaccharide biosynthesis polyprenyl glycosylphosphotransferase
VSEALTKPVAPTIVLPDAAGRTVPARPVHGRSSSAPLAPRAAQDLLTLGGLIVVTALVRRHLTADVLLWQVVFALLVFAGLVGRRAYAAGLRPELIDGLARVARAVATAGMATLTLQLVFDADAVSVGVTLAQCALAAVWLGAGRAAPRLFAAHTVVCAPTLIVGAGRVGRTVAERLTAHPCLGLRPVGFLDKEPLDAQGTGLPVLGASWDLEQVVRDYGVENVIIAFSTAPTSVVLGLVRRCEELGVTVSHVPRLFESVNGILTLEYFGGLPLVTRRPVDPKGWQFRCKYAFDRIVGSAILLLLAPLFLALAVAVWISVGSPILFRQVRVGRDGRTFEMLKFRSMRDAPAPAVETVAQAGLAPGGVEGDDRRTAVGAFLRSTSLDELPQLWNVVRGDMSLVGPRPERPRFVEMFEESVYRYGERHRVKSGITGWAQVHGLRGKTSLDDRVEWDNHYIENWSPWLDLKTLLLTVGALVHGRKVVE